MMGLFVSVSSFAQSHSDRISVGAGALYQRGLDATISWEHETRYHNAWEYFINGYIKWDECASCGHVCPESFWNNYRTWGVGAAYKPCVARGRNWHRDRIQDTHFKEIATMKILHIICATLMAVAFASCDEHRDFPDTAMKTCDILCTDGKVVRFEEVKSQNKTPIAVVFYVNQNEDIQGTGYAVYLKDIEPFAYSDSLGLKHNTSADITAFDGNGNTHAMYSSGTSPAASAVFDMWQYGQSAYIPSVAQIKLLYQARSAVNTYIRKCGGDVIPDNPDECWYWTSTEVKDQETAKAWLYSLASGALQETPKTQAHKVRPIITLYN